MTAHVHHIKDGRFVCTAAPEAPCRNYADCDCESWDPELHGDKPAAGHEPVPQDECWLKSWLDADDLGDSYADPDGITDAHGMHFPDGPIAHEYDGDCVYFEYADDTRPEWWPCDNFDAPLTCITAPSSVSARCESCKDTHADAAMDAACQAERDARTNA